MIVRGHNNFHRHSHFWQLASLLMLLVSGAATSGAEKKKHQVIQNNTRPINPEEAEKVSYARQIKPIIVDNCLECHSTEDHKGGFDATTVANLIKGGKKANPAIVAGK